MKKIGLALAAFAASFAAHAIDPPMNDPFLENLAGKWTIERRIRGTLVANTMEAKWVLQHRFLQLRMKDVADPPRYEALVMIGWDGLEQRYVAHWMDIYGGRLSAMGYGKREGNSIEFRFEYPDGPFFNTFQWNPGEQGWTMTLENSDKGGKRTPFAEDRLRRR